MERGQSAPQRGGGGGGAGGSTAAAATVAARLAPKSAREAAAKQADQEVGGWVGGERSETRRWARMPPTFTPARHAA